MISFCFVEYKKLNEIYIDLKRIILFILRKGTTVLNFIFSCACLVLGMKVSLDYC